MDCGTNPRTSSETGRDSGFPDPQWIEVQRVRRRIVLGRDAHSCWEPRRALTGLRFALEFANAILQQFPRCPAKEATELIRRPCESIFIHAPIPRFSGDL
jgi:hypothetical protein